MCAAVASAAEAAFRDRRADASRRRLCDPSLPARMPPRDAWRHDCPLAPVPARILRPAASELAYRRLGAQKPVVRGGGATGTQDPRRRPRLALLDPLHILVAKAQMVADLVDQHVPNNGGEVFAGFAPIVEDRPAVEKHHVDLGSWIGDALMWQRDPAIQAQDVERAFELHRLLGLFVGKFLDAYHQRAEMRRKFARDGFERTRGQRLDIAERGGAACGHRDILA